MSWQRLSATLHDLNVPDDMNAARALSVVESVSSGVVQGIKRENPARLTRLAFLYERETLAAFDKKVRGEDAARGPVAELSTLAYSCWTSIARSALDDKARTVISEELADDRLPIEVDIAFRLSVSGLISQRTPETRLELKRFSLAPVGDTSDWRAQVAQRVFIAFSLLVRKDQGWRDIGQALQLIDELRSLQPKSEDAYLDKQREKGGETSAAIELVGFYHLAQIITLAGQYLRVGSDSVTQANVRFDRHRDRAVEAFDRVGSTLLSHFAELLWMGCRELVHNSIWTHISGLGERLKQFAQTLASEASVQPVIELWPSQQDALRRNLLDPYKRAVLVEMPTSAGKTLLAKFSIVQTHALNPNGVVVYVVPTRALVNQVTADLRASFRELGLRVEQAVPAFELDPSEERLLSSRPHVLITTPEKLDLLIRKEHVATADLTLVIADEAHNIRDENRGARLELLLGMIKRDRPGSRFLLLSPFLPNDEELVRWLGDDRAADPISVHWRPSNKVVGIITLADRGHKRKLVLQTLAAADNADVPAGLQVPLASGKDVKKTVSGLTGATAKAASIKGSVLVLCEGPGTAMTRASQIADDMPLLPPSEDRDVVCRYIQAEMGRVTSLVQFIKRGVVYHHSGLSQETRWLIEWLIRRGEVSVVCGTTTLAQGVNFPIRTVIVESLKKGNNDLSYQDFWNIAGGAVWALMDPVGLIGFPAPDKDKEAEFGAFLKGEALEITSQLCSLLDRVDDIGDKFNLQTLFSWPQLSTLLQFLAHAAKVSGSENVAGEVEDLLRASLVFHQAQRRSRDAVRNLVKLSRAYLQHVQAEKPLVALADQTGFATPSVLLLLARKSASNELTAATNWAPSRLFGADLQPLTSRVEAIASLPEMRLGQGKGQPFNAERIASILRDWVRGDTLHELSSRYLLDQSESDPDKRAMSFSRYLFSTLIGKASWGLGALETVCLAGSDEKVWESVGHVPSMVFFGVQRKEAVWLRMVGVPRIVANGLADVWAETRANEPESYDDLRGWVNGLSDDQWLRAIPQSAPLTPQDVRRVWNQFTS